MSYSSDEENDFDIEIAEETKDMMELLRKFAIGKQFILYFNDLAKKDRIKILGNLKKTLEEINIDQRPILLRALESKTIPNEYKSDLLTKYFSPGSSPDKMMQWLDIFLKVPFNKFSPPVDINSLKGAKEILDEAVYGHDKTKHKIMSYVAQLIRNQKSAGLILGLKSYPGIGKTSLVERGISILLGRPFFSISLGGVHDSSFLRGFQYTYEGSEPGFLTNCVIRGGVMDPVLFFDELDKVSGTNKGDEIINTLIQLTDPIQSKYFQDRYLGGTATLDLSRCIIIFSYNSRRTINKVLLDRISEIELSGFTDKEKITIARDYLIPGIVRDIGLPCKVDEIMITNNGIGHIVNNYTNEAGVRRLKDVMYEIYREINKTMLLGEDESERKPKRRRKNVLYDLNEKTVDKYIKTFKQNIVTVVDKTGYVGRVNGLYVTDHGDSGIIPIEVNWIPSDTFFGIMFTGNLGKVMGESVHLAKSVAWLNIPPEKQKQWSSEWRTKKSSIHVHCPDGSTPKEGPSAGVALSLAIWSLLMNAVIPPGIGITGELSLSGEITAVGGLTEKLQGAFRAECKKVVIPLENEKDVPSDCPLKIHCVTNFSEVLKLVAESS